MLQFDVITIFPELIQQAVSYGLLGKACEQNLLAVQAHDLRAFTEDKHRRVDDQPYGGGPGMVLQVEPVVRALEEITDETKKVRKILLSPRGEVFSQVKARDFTEYEQIILICGRYEGVDARVLSYVDEELSIGDYVLAGGEFASLVTLDAVARLLPGVVGDEASLAEESHSQNLLEYPHYTRPEVFRGQKVPDVLLSGHHQQIKEWRQAQAEGLTQERRPDLWKKSR